MLVTELEAKEMVCPLPRHESTGNGCYGSRCMWFRFLPDVEITLANGMVAVVEECDADIADAGGWWWDGKYVRSNQGRLHRQIVIKHLGPIPEGMEVDHLDRDRLNNRLSNLRLCSRSENATNYRGRGASGYRGVFQTSAGKWQAQIAKGGKRLTLGTFDNKEEAAAAYDEAAKEIHGDHAFQNIAGVSRATRRGFCGMAGSP